MTLAIGTLSVAVVAAGLSTPLPFLTLEPGPTSPAHIIVEQAATHPSKGEFLITTVNLTQETTMLELLVGMFDSKVDVIDQQSLIPPGTDEEEFNRITAAQMGESQISAIVAGLEAIGQHVTPNGAAVLRTFRETPAEGKLNPGDVITAVDGKPVTDVPGAVKLIRSRKAGESVRLTVQSGDQSSVLELPTIAAGQSDSPVPVVGAELTHSFELPFPVRINAERIGGPSAGLTFALQLVNLLTADDLTGGRKIAATGEIAVDGEVGQIGGIRQKVAGAERDGAEIFIIPMANLEEARSVASDDLKIIGVSTLKEAIEALRGLD